MNAKRRDCEDLPDEELTPEVDARVRAQIDRAEREIEEVLSLEARRQAIRQLQEMDGLELDRPDVMAEAWR